MRIPRAPWATLIPCVALLGCQMGDVKQVLPLAGGGTVAVQLTMQGPVPGEADGYRGTSATAVPTKEKRTLQYAFGLLALKKPDLTRIEIVDMSDDVPEPLVDDRDPKFNAQNQWYHTSETISADDPRVKWIFTLPLAFRTYRYTLTHKDGTQTMFYHVGTYPTFMKAAIRSSWGETY